MDLGKTFGNPFGAGRAVITLSLVVLFTASAITLLQSLARPDRPARRLDNDGEDGCDVDIADPTPDEDLPAARGGVG